MKSHAIAVKQLAEFVHRRGDLYDPGGRVRAEEGNAAHVLVQRKRTKAGFDCELTVREEFAGVGCSLLVRGRADAAHLTRRLVEEFKTTRERVSTVKPEHMAQAKMYAAMLLTEEHGPTELWTARVSYIHPDTQALTTYDEQLTSAQLRSFLEVTVRHYLGWLEDFSEHRDRLVDGFEALRFPFSQLRPYQRALVRRCAESYEQGESLLLEAPTGSGKTLGVMYPAIRALNEASRLWFLTSRTTGQAAAIDAAERIAGSDLPLRTIALTAKEKICPVPGQPCDPELCDLARGYYDRREDAVKALVAQGAMLRDQVERVAQMHQVCPFELSLDAALWADLIIGDYNYIFDPVVRLQRFAQDAEATLLIDETHHLSGRVADMLTIELQRATIKAAIDVLPQPVAKAANALDRQLTSMRRAHPDSRTELVVINYPDKLASAAQNVVQSLQEWQAEHPTSALTSEVQALLFECARWVKGGLWRDAAEFVTTIDASHRTNVVVRDVCVDPARYIRAMLDEFGPNVRFSATASPPELYQYAHGFSNDASFARAGSPFVAEQLATLVVNDVPTYYRQRQATLADLGELVRNVVTAKEGRYLLCFPSYAYLQQFAVHITLPQGCRLLAQKPGMGESDRSNFLLELAQADATLVAAVVMGGIFTESIDLVDTPLTGVIVVGVALPPPDPVRDAARTLHEQSGKDGRLITYVQPGMAKVVQAAGRLIRARHHRGVLVLVDARYLEPMYRQFFPALWQPEVVSFTQITSRLTDFWNHGTVHPTH